jgi:hypothetical protein
MSYQLHAGCYVFFTCLDALPLLKYHRVLFLPKAQGTTHHRTIMAGGAFLMSLLPANSLYVFPTAILAWVLGNAIYRLHFHPLAGVPGPKLAAITWLYQTYYSFVGGSRFYLHIEKLHHKYGMCSLATRTPSSSA